MGISCFRLKLTTVPVNASRCRVSFRKTVKNQENWLNGLAWAPDQRVSMKQKWRRNGGSVSEVPEIRSLHLCLYIIRMRKLAAET
jgi:hypothetical protein